MYSWILEFIVLVVIALQQAESNSRLLKDEYWRGLVVQPQGSYSPTDNNLHRDVDVVSLFSKQDIQTLNSLITQFLNLPGEQMWTHVQDVSTKQPFILFHQRKAGGSSLRQTLNFAANELHLPSFFPCRNKVPCDTYHLPKDDAYAIYGGHFHWGVQDELGRFDRSLRRSFQCTTNFRHPIDRIESCFYFRFGTFLNSTCLSDLSEEKFEELIFKLDPFGTSCINEPFRALSGLHDEEIIDSLMMSRLIHRPAAGGSGFAAISSTPSKKEDKKATTSAAKSKQKTTSTSSSTSVKSKSTAAATVSHHTDHEEDAVIHGGKPDEDNHHSHKASSKGSKFKLFKTSSSHHHSKHDEHPKAPVVPATPATSAAVVTPVTPLTPPVSAGADDTEVVPSTAVQETTVEAPKPVPTSSGTISKPKQKPKPRPKQHKVVEEEGDADIDGGKEGRRRLQQYTDPKQVLMIFNNTLSHVVRCPPVVLELPGTFNLLDDRIPKLGNVGGFQSGYQTNSGDKSSKKCKPLSGDRLKRIKEHAALELILYDAVVRKTAFQLSKSYGDYLLQMHCASGYRDRNEIVPPMTPPLPHIRAVPLLLSDYNDMSLSIRRIIEYSTGFIVGSLATRPELVNAFAGESLCHHVKTLVVFGEPSDVTVKLHPDTMHPYFAMHGGYNRKCTKHGGIKHFEKAMIMINDPFFVIYEAIRDKESPTDQFQTLLTTFDQRAFDSETMFASFSADEDLLEKAFYDQSFSMFVTFPMYKTLFRNYFVVYHNQTVATSIYQRTNLMKVFQTSKMTPKYLMERYKFVSPLAVLTEANQYYQLLVNQTKYDVKSNTFVLHDESPSKPKFVQTPEAFSHMLQYLLGERMNLVTAWPDWKLSCGYPNIQLSGLIRAQLHRYTEARKFYIAHPKIYQKARAFVNQWASLIGLQKEQLDIMFKM